MSFPTVPAVQAWTCQPEDFTQHLTETQAEERQREMKGRRGG